jgi:hypothetical protein
MEKVEAAYRKAAARGIILSYQDLVALRAKLGLESEVSAADLRSLRYRQKFLAMHARSRYPAPHFVTASISKIGNVFLDMADFFPNLRVFNKQCAYFLVGVDSLSQKLACYPFPNKSRASWEKGARLMIEKDFAYVTTFVSDRDTAVSGEAFQRRIKKELGIDWLHLPNRDKSFLAEEKIGFLKDRLSQGMKLRSPPKDKVWVDLIPGVLADFNNRFVTGTRIRRSDVTKSNQLDILRQRHGVSDPTVLFNNAVVGKLSDRMEKRLQFRFRVGDKVRLSNTANYELKSNYFAKKSVKGSYSAKVYTVTAVRLKSNRDLFLSQVYKLRGLQGYFYDRELIPAYFSDSP